MRALPIALTIAGSDSGGGAGIQADLKTFAALGVHGTSIVTCLTAQNPRGVLGTLAVEPAFVRRQLEAVFSELPPKAIKTGMLFSSAIIETVHDFLGEMPKRPPIVVDPVMVATSGAMLLEESALAAMKRLFGIAAVITPNLQEAETILATKISSPEELRAAARELHERFACAALVKGGHLRGASEAIDFFSDGKNDLMLSAPFVRGVSTHGTGCTYAAAIAARLARGFALTKAVSMAKGYISTAIAHSRRIGKHQALGWL